MIVAELPFFPSPYPDELLYSVFARYHRWSCNPISEHTTRDLFGRPVTATWELPGKLRALCDRLSLQQSISPESLIWDHTLYPLFAPFLPSARQKKILELMVYAEDNKLILKTSGISSHSLKPPRFLRYCPVCIKHDEDKYGEPYWHRTHQVTGIKVCPLHECWLMDSKIAVHEQRDRMAYYCLEPDHLQDEPNLFEDWKNFARHYEISRIVYWYLMNKIQPIGTDEIRSRYLARLWQMGLVTVGGLVKQIMLIKHLKDFYSDDFMTQMGCEIDNSDGDNWASDLLRNRCKTAHPVRHIILMRALNIDPQEFWGSGSAIPSPFGVGPWPCLNPVAAHYRDNVIKECSITRNNITAGPIGTFHCECGYSYSRCGPDQNDKDRYRADKTLAYGPLWDKELTRLVENEGKSYRKVAAVLCICHHTVKKQLQRIQEEKIPSNNGVDEKEGKRQQCRNCILKTIELQPSATRTDIRTTAVAEYDWLYRNDRKWLREILPAPLPPGNNISRSVDWGKRDSELASKVPFAAEQVKREIYKPIRITLKEIGKRIGAKGLSKEKLSKLPATQKAIHAVAESIEAFQLRKLHVAADSLVGLQEDFSVQLLLFEKDR